MLEAVVNRLCEVGHRVTVLCADGGYASGTKSHPQDQDRANELAGVAVIRIGATKFGRGTFFGKLMDYASFYFGVGWKLISMSPRPDRVVALTTPPYLAVLARVFSKFRGGDHAHWIMDLYPDVMIAHGMLGAGRIPHRLLAWLTRFGFGGARCASVVTLGPDMAARVSEYMPADSLAKWVPLWSSEGPTSAPEDGGFRSEKQQDRDDQAGQELRKQRGWKANELVLMYSGNMGLGHRFGEFLEAARELSKPFVSSAGEPIVRFVFYGGGKRRVEIERFIREFPDALVELHDYVPREQLAAHLRSADIHLASLEPSWSGTMLPSKLQGIFAAARPVIYVGSSSSSTARWIEESGGGWVVEAGQVGSLLAAIEDASSSHARRVCGEIAKRFHDDHFNRSRNSRKLSVLLGKNRSGAD